MGILFRIIVIVLLSIVCTYTILSIICWFTYKNNVRSRCSYYGKCNFKVFMKHYLKYKNELKYYAFWSCLSSDNDKSKIYEDLIAFDDKGMILDYISYIKFLLFFYKIQRLNQNKKEQVEWK